MRPSQNVLTLTFAISSEVLISDQFSTFEFSKELLMINIFFPQKPFKKQDNNPYNYGNYRKLPQRYSMWFFQAVKIHTNTIGNSHFVSSCVSFANGTRTVVNFMTDFNFS